MAQDKRKYISTQFEGVYYRISTKRDPRTGDYDRIYCFSYVDNFKKQHWKTVGRHSEGVRVQTARAARVEFLAELNAGRNPVINDTVTVGDAVEAYVAWAHNECKHVDKPLQQYNKHVRARIHAVPISSVTTGMLTTIRDELTRKRMSPQSIHHHFSFIRRVINYAIRTNRWNGINPVASQGGWKMPKVDNGRLRFFTPDEAKILLDELKKRSPQLHDMALLSLKTGLRATEIFRLKGEDVDPRGNVLHIIAKGGERQIVHAPPSIIDMLLAYKRKPGEYIFQERDTGQPIKRISKTFERAVQAIGNATRDSQYRITFHTLRHTFASWLAQSGKVTLLELKELMRHETLTMTQRYAHLIPSQTAKKLIIIDDFLKEHN
mgnify:CR=1 FL=1